MRLSILLIAVLGIGIGWLWWSQQRDAGSPAWQGYAEADYVKVAPVEQGLLTGISVGRGDQIATGAATDVRLGFGCNANHSLLMSPL